MPIGKRNVHDKLRIVRPWRTCRPYEVKHGSVVVEERWAERWSQRLQLSVCLQELQNFWMDKNAAFGNKSQTQFIFSPFVSATSKLRYISGRKWMSLCMCWVPSDIACRDIALTKAMQAEHEHRQWIGCYGGMKSRHNHKPWRIR